jgi:hypothetical protein
MPYIARSRRRPIQFATARSGLDARNINRHTVQLHARNCRGYRIDHFLALSIDVIKQLILLRVPKHAAQHGIESGILNLFRRKDVG